MPSQCVWLVCESSGGIFWPTFAMNFHVALWAICWVVGLCNILHLTLLPADFGCFVSYYSTFCAFCVWYGFNSSYYHINKLLIIYAILCHVWIIPEQNASKIIKISQQMAKLWRKLKWLVFFLGHGVFYCWRFYPLYFFSSTNLGGLWANRHQILPHVRWWL